MIKLYCNKKHGGSNGELCNECRELEEYAHKRLTYCKFGNEKSSCKSALFIVIKRI